MKNLFVISVTYTKPLEFIESIVLEHREFLEQGVNDGLVIAVGPLVPRTGGVIIGSFKDKEAAIAFTQDDPFFQHKAADYSVVEFTPVLSAEFMKGFLGA